MRLLLDQNLPPRLLGLVADLYPGSLHVRDVGLQRADDLAIWAYATAHQLVIISKDSDFHQMSFLLGHPPKVIWVRLGNCSTEVIAMLIRAHAAAIEDFLLDEDAGFLALG